MATTSPAKPATNPEEDGQGKNLTILEHLQELRYRMMVCGGGLVVAMVAAAVVAGPVMRWLKKPAESRVANFELIFTQPLEYWTTYFQVMLLIGIAMSMPLFLYQAMAFVGPGLTRNEKRWAYPIILGASAMFLLGAGFAYYIEMPPALGFLLNGGDIASPFITVKSYFSFATRLMFVTGIVFETPFLVMGLAKIGLVTSRSLLRWWRLAFLGAFVISAIVTPSIDPITQTLVALPMFILYMVGILFARLVEKTPIIPRA
jgi:sec-independent protein translocase protein TatC